MKKQLLSFMNIPDSLCARYQVMSRMFEKPLSAVVFKAVVDLVAQRGAIVFQVDQVPWQVNPLPPLLISIGKYLVA